MKPDLGYTSLREQKGLPHIDCLNGGAPQTLSGILDDVKKLLCTEVVVITEGISKQNKSYVGCEFYGGVVEKAESMISLKGKQFRLGLDIICDIVPLESLHKTIEYRGLKLYKFESLDLTGKNNETLYVTHIDPVYAYREAIKRTSIKDWRLIYAERVGKGNTIRIVTDEKRTEEFPFQPDHD